MFQFVDESYLRLLPIILGLFLFLFWWVERNKKRLFQSIGDKNLLHKIMPDNSLWRRIVKYGLLLLSLALTIIMIARPQYGMKQSLQTKKGIEIAFMVDVSNSMLADDVYPNRLERVKNFLSSLIDKLQEDKISLGVFAGEAFPELPMTSDYNAAKIFVDALSTDMVSTQGTNIAAAIETASTSFSDNKKVGKAIILLTDGEDHEGKIEEVLDKINKSKIQLFVVGVGTADGGSIKTVDGFLQNSQGETVVTRFNEQECKNLASLGNGMYVYLDNTDVSLKQLVAALSSLQQSDNVEQLSSKNEQFQAFAILILILLLVEFFMLDRKNHWFKR